jgi:hypothetical protein
MDNANKTLAICGMIPDYPDFAQYDVTWGINGVYSRVNKLDRLYYFDDRKLIADDFVEKVNACGCEVVTKWPDPEIPKSVQYPLDEIVEHFGFCNFTCSVAYAIAHALFEGYRKITLCGMYHLDDSYEYFQAKPCVDMWCGIAIWRGASLKIWGNSFLLKPYRWESPVYGWETNETRWLHVHTLAGAFKACGEYPLLPVVSKPPIGYNLPNAVIQESISHVHDRFDGERIEVEQPSNEQASKNGAVDRRTEEPCGAAHGCCGGCCESRDQGQIESD